MTAASHTRPVPAPTVRLLMVVKTIRQADTDLEVCPGQVALLPNLAQYTQVLDSLKVYHHNIIANRALWWRDMSEMPHH